MIPPADQFDLRGRRYARVGLKARCASGLALDGPFFYAEPNCRVPPAPIDCDYFSSRKNALPVPTATVISMNPPFCIGVPLTVVQLGEVRLAVDFRTYPVALAGHRTITLLPLRTILRLGRGGA